ncbi:MAG: hypothetical protein ACKON9_28435, partial [Planctomycetaceae bacterium]
MQRTVFEIDSQIRERDLRKIESADFVSKRDEIAKQIEESGAEVAAKQAEQATLLSDLAAKERVVEAIEVDLKFRNSDRDEARANYDLAVRDALPDTLKDARLEEYRRRQGMCDELQRKLDAEKELLAELAGRSKQLTAKLDELTGAQGKLSAEADRMRAALENIRPSSTISALKRSLMELPIIDGFNSHLKIVQDWVPKLEVTLGMAKIARFDRCRTCHQNIDKTGPGGVPAYPAGHPATSNVADWVAASAFPQPFSTHPNTDLYCSASSPHPVGTFGCTICHDGQGSGTSFANAEHTPNDPHLAEDWHHEYGFHPNH